MHKHSDPGFVARHEMAIGLTSLFRALPDGARRQEIVLEQKFAGGHIRLMGVELSAFEQAIFFALLSMAEYGSEIDAESADLVPPLPPPGMSAKSNTALPAPALAISTTCTALCRDAGLEHQGSNTIRAVRIALQRMGGITIAATDSSGKGGFVSLLRARWDGDGIEVAINPRSAAACLALRSYGAVNMRAYISLSTPTAKVLYAWLCAWFSAAGGSREIGLDKLEEHVWGKAARAKATRSKRRELLMSGLVQINGTGKYHCEVVGRTATITRADRPSGEPHARPAVNRPLSENDPRITVSA